MGQLTIQYQRLFDTSNALEYLMKQQNNRGIEWRMVARTR